MQRVVVVDRQKIKLDPSKILGVGGEGTVVQVGNDALKIFHQPSSARAEKLRDFMKLGTLPPAVCAPLKLAYDSTGRTIIGYLMRRLSPQYEVTQLLASKKFRRQHPSITSAVITNIHLNGHDTIGQLHKLGIIIGDNNDLNALFWRERMVYIDPDSFQFGDYPCAVGTEHFLDPRLYDVQLAAKPRFKTLDDWYAWYVMFIRSLLMVHPYGGVHKKHKTIPQRALARLTFRDLSVRYPKAGLHPDLMDDSLATMFDRMFEKGERFIPDPAVFINYRDSLRDCSSCGVMYPSEKATCPQCAKVNTQQVQRQVRVVKKPGKRTVNSETLVSTPGQILWRHLAEHKLFVIANEKQMLVLYRHEPNVPLTRMTLGPFAGTPKFDLFAGKFLVYNKGDDQLRVFDVSGDKPTDTGERYKVDLYQGEPAFACSKDHLLRLSQGFLFRTGFVARFNRFSSDSAGAVSRDQTWIAASSHSTLVFGCQRFFDTLKFFTNRFDPTQQWYSPISDLQQDESIIDVSTLFTSSAVLMLLKTEIKGRTYTHIYVLHKDAIKSQAKVEAISSDLYDNIHGKAFGVATNATAIVLHPTDDGIVQESIVNGNSQAVLLEETTQFVSDGDSLDQYGSGILVTGDQLVNYLTIS
ncbi:MAG: hypothetical protein ACXAC5_01720 [Promethearchaeota archaeon]|jgi:H/ACA ribonucleoprotein complex subunit 3